MHFHAFSMVQFFHRFQVNTPYFCGYHFHESKDFKKCQFLAHLLWIFYPFSLLWDQLLPPPIPRGIPAGIAFISLRNCRSRRCGVLVVSFCLFFFGFSAKMPGTPETELRCFVVCVLFGYIYIYSCMLVMFWSQICVSKGRNLGTGMGLPKHIMPCHKCFRKKINGAVVSDFVK